MICSSSSIAAVLVVSFGFGCAARGAPVAPLAAPRDAGTVPSAPTYPVLTRPPKDKLDPRLIKTLTREASAAVVCRLRGLTDVFPGARDPDVFYDAACEVEESLRGPLLVGPVHFIWQVERDARMPPPDSRLVVYLKRRNRPLDGPPPLEWVALDTGVLPYTPSLQEYLHPKSQKGRR
jgi:hypothetical protein